MNYSSLGIMSNTKGPRTIEMETALAEAHGLLGEDAFEAARSILWDIENMIAFGDTAGKADAIEAAKLARDYAREQMEEIIADGGLSPEDLADWTRLQKLV